MALSKTAKFYRENPRSRNKHRETQREINKSPSQIKYRSELNSYNRKHGVYGNGDNKDASHINGKIKGYSSAKTNRGSKTASAGDRRVRGKKKCFHKI